MTHDTLDADFFSRSRRYAAHVATGVAATLLMVIVIAAGAVVAMVALALASLALAGVAVVWLAARLTRGRRRRASGGPVILEARKGPRGWTTDTAGRFGT